MKKISVERLKPGMVTEKPIVTKRGQVIAPAGTELTSQLIARLSFYKIPSVMITNESDMSDIPLSDSGPSILETAVVETEPEPAEKPVEEPPKPSERTTVQNAQSYSQKVKATSQFQEFQTNYSKNMVRLKESFDAIISGNTASAYHSLLEEASELFASKTSLELFDMIHSMRSVNDSVYAHSLNVALIARAIGKWLHLSKEDLNILTQAGLLHDIGKTQIPPEILNKQSALTDEEFQLIKGHAKLGNKILAKTNLDTRIKLAALQHHERYDGSGYPRGLESDEIDYFASIIAIADVYDAMSAARSYRAPKCVFQVVDAFEQDGIQKYNPTVILTFLKRVVGCFNNSRVMLSNGVSGKIVFFNQNALARPIIETDNSTMIDLSSPANKDIYIQSVL